jgi:tRNA A37 threonylcarbamoyladenosine modification protein TsaB
MKVKKLFEEILLKEIVYHIQRKYVYTKNELKKKDELEKILNSEEDNLQKLRKQKKEIVIWSDDKTSPAAVKKREIRKMEIAVEKKIKDIKEQIDKIKKSAWDRSYPEHNMRVELYGLKDKMADEKDEKKKEELKKTYIELFKKYNELLER